MKQIYRANLLARIFFLILTPTVFRYLGFAFIWHSIYWGTITFVVLLWGFFILCSPFIGRVGCGWLCFVGTTQDLVNECSLIHIKRQKPFLILRIINLIMFLTSAFVFFFINLKSGTIHQIRWAPFFLTADFTSHYKFVWLYDCIGAILLGLFLDKRWACRNLCVMGSLCAVGASHSRLLPVINLPKCTKCGICERVCPANIPIRSYIETKQGLVTDSECLICGKCIKECKSNAINLKMIWNRRKYMAGMKAKDLNHGSINISESLKG